MKEVALLLSVFLVAGAALTHPPERVGLGDDGRRFTDSPPRVLDNRSFWRISSGPPVLVPAGLIGTSDSAYWYLEDALARVGLNYTAQAMNTTMSSFESLILARLHSAFGVEPLPPNDIDGDPRTTILITPDLSVFDPRNEQSVLAEPTSNEREMIYVQYESDPELLLRRIAHEFTHLIEWNYDPAEQGWILEGLAQVAERVAGYDTEDPPFYLKNTTVGLWSGVFHWQASYGAWELLVLYLADHFGGWGFTRALTQNRLQGVAGVESSLAALGYSSSFRSVFRDWTVANLVNNETADGAKWKYANFTGRAMPTGRIDRMPWTGRLSVENGGVAYLGIVTNETTARIRAEVSGADADSILATVIVQEGETVRVTDARVIGPANVTVDIESLPIGARLTLAVAYLNETGYPEVTLFIRASSIPPPGLPLVYLGTAGLLVAVVAVLAIIAVRKRGKRGRPSDNVPKS